jgi:DNA-directed RNA polymerase subunit N (RpoN/RPB10)
VVMLLARRGWTMARVNWSRWIADCPAPSCTSALQINRGEAWFRCWDCGEVAEIEWPDYADEVERILLMRPDPHTRNWQQGETLQDLYTENLEHGILPASPELLIASAGRRPLFLVGDDRILVDRAPLPSGQRRQIGG